MSKCLIRVGVRMQDWWRDVRADPDRRANLLFLYASILLTTATIAAFLWLTGILDWRGSDGHTSLTLDLSCDEKAVPGERDACRMGVESSDRITARLDLRDNDHLGFQIGRAIPGQDWPSEILNGATGVQITSNRSFKPSVSSVSTNARVTHLDANWNSSRIQPLRMERIDFGPAAVTRFTGLSEREFLIEINLVVLHGMKTMVFILLPPEGFDVVEAAPSAEPLSGGRGWTMRLSSNTGDFAFRVRMRNFEAARLDHILDSSIAAVLGVSVGGIISSYLALVLLRRRRKPSP